MCTNLIERQSENEKERKREIERERNWPKSRSRNPPGIEPHLLPPKGTFTERSEAEWPDSNHHSNMG